MIFVELNARNHKPTHAAFMALYRRIGLNQRELSERTGICRRRVRYLVAGHRETPGKTYAVTMTYMEQYGLECLAVLTELGK